VKVAIERLVTAVNRLAHAVEALLRFELMAERRRQEERDVTD
jgi:hypothetical protein